MTSNKFRKKPVVITAEQWFPDRIVKGVLWEQESCDDGEFLKPYVITAHEQRAYLAPGDWVIPEPKPDRFYPCKPDIFEATYEPIAAALQQQQPQAPAGGEWPVPDGWKLVPVEPTQRMLEACRDEVNRLIVDDQEVDIWAAMLAASPTSDQGSDER